jgi:S-adenosylmethionine:tRNA ribosyltransferase-isomerase
MCKQRAPDFRERNPRPEAAPEPYNLPVLVSDFHYDLPPERIAQEPLPDRAGSRLLHLNRQPADGPKPSLNDRNFRQFPDLLRSDDLLVLNNTRVLPARLYGRRSGPRAQSLSPQNPAARDFLRGQVEVLLTRQMSADPNEWECLVRPGRKIGVGEKLYFGRPPAGDALDDPAGSAPPFPEAELEAEVIARGNFGERRIRFAPVPDFFSRIERIGHVPLPPYIDREDRPADRTRYQTIYAQAPTARARSVAAPTAGLHFTPEILQQIRDRGIEIAQITLHVGLGTFQPVRAKQIEDHKLHRECYEIPEEAAKAINLAKAERRRIVAVGTTTVRALEAAANSSARNAGPSAEENRLEAGRGEAELFIYPGYRFRMVDALLTNFHLPQSTLLMLVCALAGKELVMAAYRRAVAAGYRFYSYGDCMFIE